MNANTINNILIKFGDKIKSYRKRNGKSQFELAIRLEMDPKTLRKIENGQTVAKYDNVVKIMAIIQNITLEELLETK